ncbi:unnamed protein product [Ilex paraguariensis]|uniref:Uncharacterized protein n=1 Tax=Ilex paraguariensis TaxID=185542 RepID=A0ABC8SLY3_9AQUA
MSNTPNKRLHEEGGGGSHSSSTKYTPDDSDVYPGVGAKTASSAINEYQNNTPMEIGQDTRMSKMLWTELRDADRRSPLLPPMYRMSSSQNDSHSDHPASSENRLESRDSKGNNKELKVENRDIKEESRELPQGGKGDKDVRFESRGDDTKEAKYDRDTYTEYKGEMKLDKEGYGTVNSHLNWKESKEHYRGKRYPDTPGGNVDHWHRSRSNVHGQAEIVKEASCNEERDHVEAHEAVGENKVNFKGEDKFKDKDRKKKDGKHREWGERDKERSDRRNNLQLGNSSNDGKDLVMEEREVGLWDRERKDISKDKNKMKDLEKDHTKRETWNGAEREGSNGEKELMDVSGRALEQDDSPFEQKKQKNHDSWKSVDSEARDRRKERDADMEGERPEKRNRCYDKESDDGCVDADGGTEMEREVFNYGVQQNKRMLRSRGSPQVANCEPHSRSCTQDNEGYVLPFVGS